jgi:hypothetical protein
MKISKTRPWEKGISWKSLKIRVKSGQMGVAAVGRSLGVGMRMKMRKFLVFGVFEFFYRGCNFACFFVLLCLESVFIITVHIIVGILVVLDSLSW